jgi:hypothetical protein
MGSCLFGKCGIGQRAGPSAVEMGERKGHWLLTGEWLGTAVTVLRAGGRSWWALMLRCEMGNGMVRALGAGSLLLATFELTGIGNADGPEVSAVPGFAMLFLRDLKIDRRDGLADFTYGGERLL